MQTFKQMVIGFVTLGVLLGLTTPVMAEEANAKWKLVWARQYDRPRVFVAVVEVSVNPGLQDVEVLINGDELDLSRAHIYQNNDLKSGDPNLHTWAVKKRGRVLKEGDTVQFTIMDVDGNVASSSMLVCGPVLNGLLCQ